MEDGDLRLPRRAASLGAFRRPHADGERHGRADAGGAAGDRGCDQEIAPGLVHFSLLVHGDAFLVGGTRKAAILPRGRKNVTNSRVSAYIFKGILYTRPIPFL